MVETKTGYPTAEMYIKNEKLQLFIAEGIITLEEFVEVGLTILYSKDLLPALLNKGEKEIEAEIKSWYNNEKTIDEILKLELAGDTFEQFYEFLSDNFNIDFDLKLLISKKQAMLILAALLHTKIHAITIEWPNGQTESFEWFRKKLYIVRYTLLQNFENIQ